MRTWRLTPDRAAEAVEVLRRVLPEFPASDALPPAERRRVAVLLHSRTIETGLARGRIDVWGDPIVGVAVWLVRPALNDPGPSPQPRVSGERLSDLISAGVIARLEAFDAVLQRLHAVARPDRHVYLDMLGVVPAHRRRGIATALMEAGQAWADGLGLPCALDTDTAENVAFYERRGYRTVDRERLPDSSGRDLVAMRRELGRVSTNAAETNA
ncbi:MAG TPA: GNAT family N-acetyltransferase [Candidatus Binatia bacterium]|nr:GNAT family N-acetyltransferase [Candidatus Binatia bacterium]